MNYQEAIEIAEVCRPDKWGDKYPPINPAVLLEAARAIYLEEGATVKVSVIVKWLAGVAANRPLDSLEPSWLEE